MPDGARHTSGLALNGTYLIAVDYGAERVYRMDLEASLSSGTAEDVMSFDTTIRNASAAAFVSFGQREYLAITQHSYSAKTFLIDIKKARLAGTAVDSIVFTYRSASFSQGIAFNLLSKSNFLLLLYLKVIIKYILFYHQIYKKYYIIQ